MLSSDPSRELPAVCAEKLLFSGQGKIGYWILQLYFIRDMESSEDFKNHHVNPFNLKIHLSIQHIFI